MTSSNTTASAVGTTAGTAIRASLTVPCEAGQVRAVREFVGATLGDTSCADIPVLLASELATNSVMHSDSRLPGGTITVIVTSTPDVARIEIHDAGGMSAPSLNGTHEALAEGGRGLRLVNELAARWNYRRDADGLVTWFEVRAEPPS